MAVSKAVLVFFLALLWRHWRPGWVRCPSSFALIHPSAWKRNSQKFGHQSPSKAKKFGRWEDASGSLMVRPQDREETVTLGGPIDT